MELDRTITAAVNGWAGHSRMLDLLMVGITQAGVPILVALVVIQWWVRGERFRQRHVIVAAGLSFLGGLALNQLVLLGVHRPRPYLGGLTHLLIAPSTDPSFPSDHATASVAIAAAFLLNGMPRRGLFFLGAAVVLCLSRIYVGTHYFTDVLGGAATGLVAAVIVKALYHSGTRVDRLVTSIL